MQSKFYKRVRLRFSFSATDRLQNVNGPVCPALNLYAYGNSG